MNRLLVLRLSALGDVIHTIPAVVALRDAIRPTPISWVVEAPYAELVEIVAGVQPIPIRMRKWGSSLVASRHDVFRAIRAMRGVDVSVDFQGLVKSSILGLVAGARVRYGFDAAALREKAALLFTTERVDVRRQGHVVDMNLDLAAGVAPIVRETAVDFAPFAADPDARLCGLEDAVVLLPGAGKPNKLWPVERFRELAGRIGPAALSVWGPGEREMAEAIGARVAPATSLRELAWLLRHAKLVIGADTGPLHLAAALGVPVIGLFGPTDPKRNGPYGQVDHCIETFGTTKLMTSIRVEDVMTRVESVLAS